MTNLLDQTLIKIANFLSENNIPYMIIGGLANAVWGNPRSTIDIDVTIWIKDEKIEETILLFETEFDSLVDSPQNFVLKTRVLPVKTKDDIKIDIIFGALPFEYDAITRTVEISISGTHVKFCSPEDLILLKIVSKREKDLDDVKGIVKNQLKKLDLSYLEPRIEELSTILENPEISNLWNKCKKNMT